MRQPFAGAKGPADQPAPREGENSKIAHQELLEKAKSGRIDLYFAGDCVVRRWGATDYPEFLAHWQRTFFGWNAANFGWGADSTKHVLWRLLNGELDGVCPKVMVLLIGANNIGNLRRDDDTEVSAQLISGIRAILEACRQKAPGATIILMGIMPRNDGPDGPLAVMPTINRVNQSLAALANGKTIRFLSINEYLADTQGHLFRGMTEDGVHLSLAGYEIWANALRPLLFELLGPPSKEDHAPAPTGDPSAR